MDEKVSVLFDGPIYTNIKKRVFLTHEGMRLHLEEQSDSFA